MVQIHPKHIIFAQSAAQTLSALELLTVSLTGGPQSYSTRRRLYTKEGSKAKGSGSGQGQTCDRGHKLQKNKQTKAVTTNRRKEW